VAVDHSDNVIVTGFSTGSGGSYDYATVKYPRLGGPMPAWINRYNGPANGNDCASTVAVDGSDNVIVTGYSTGIGSGYDYTTIKYSSDGIPLWTNRYNVPGNGDDYATAMVVDGNNNVIVTGYSRGGSGYDYATIKYSSAGVPLWTNRYDGPEATLPEGGPAVAVDGCNNVIVTGYSTGSGGGYDYATIKYSSAGVELWTNRYNAGGASAVAVDRGGNVIVTGYSTDSGIGYDFATIKYICVPSPVVTGLPLTNGAFQLRVDGVLQPGTLVIEASPDLAAWTPVFTNTAPTNVVFYADPDTDNRSARYYRAFQFP
jgi:hypothetical protein